MYTRTLALLFGLAGLSPFAGLSQTETKPVKTYYSDPAISADEQEIAFSSGGDIWTVPANGGEARLLISNPAFDSRPLYSPNGEYLAFNSTRTGNGDIYLFNLKTNELRRLTYDDGNDNPSAWSPDSKYIYYSSSSRDISSMNDIFRLKVSGGTPMPVSNNRYITEFFGAPSPNGKTLAITARGYGATQWWRNGSSHLDQSELWLMNQEGEPAYEKITTGGAKEGWPMWSKDGSSLYYVSDRSGAQNLWVKPANQAPKQLTAFTKGRVIWPGISLSGKTIIFERDFGIWKYDIATAKATEIVITSRGAAATGTVEHRKFTDQFRGLVLSPDAKKVGFIAHGDVFAASSKTGGDAFRVTQGRGIASQLEWSRTSNTIFYVLATGQESNIFQYDFIKQKTTQLTRGNHDDSAPLVSPNGKQLAFVRNGKNLVVLNLATNEEKIVASGSLGASGDTSTGDVAWSPDSKWLAYGNFGVKNLYNVFVVPAAGGEPIQASFLANSFGGDISWSPNGKYLLFLTGQRTELVRLARIDLIPQLPRFREEQFQQLFTDPGTPASPLTPKPAPAKTASPIDTIPKKSGVDVRIVSNGIRQRMNLLPFDVGVSDYQISKDGNTLVLSGSGGRQSALYTYSLNENTVEPATLKIVPGSEGGFRSGLQLSSDARELYYLEQGKIAVTTLETKTAKTLNIAAEMDVDFDQEKMMVFQQAWNIQNKRFYDENFHGVNWNEVRNQYAKIIAGVRSPDELRRVLNLMVGELNASHSGVAAPGSATSIAGRLGLSFDRTSYEKDGRYKITEIVPLGAADLAGGIHIGDVLAAIDGLTLTGNENLDELLQNKIGRRVTLTITSEKGPAQVNVRPVNATTEKGLMYRAWVEQQRQYVNKISNGKLGYVHLYDMSEQSLNQLYLDLDADNQSKEGIVVDVRNNNGGFVNAYALDVLTRKPYLTMTVRGTQPSPARTQLGQRSLEKPTILVTNQHSLSDAEDFTEGYRTMGLGKVVGEPTAGWIIFTSETALLDGSLMRMPFSKITDHEGKDMELHPRAVDILVSRALGEGDAKDSQLDVAVKELLKQIVK